MSDEIDRASEQEQALRDAAIRSASTFSNVLKPCGKCLNCGEDVASELRFCDGDCRDDFQYRNEQPARLEW